MNNFTHIHSSGRFDTPEGAFRRALQKYVNQASIVTVTEVNRESRERIMREVGRASNYGVVTGDGSGRDDCGIMFDKEIWEYVTGFTRQIIPAGAYHSKGGRPVSAFYA